MKINDEDNLIPEKTLLIVPNRFANKEKISELIEPLSKHKKRDWFNEHFYYCLPLIIGNQYGFVLKTQYNFSVRWNGGDQVDDLEVNIHDLQGLNLQTYVTNFGKGILTVQNFFHFRTPPDVNLMTIQPPNFLKDGIMHMTGVIETDNLRRDFTFNLKVTRPNEWIHFKIGDPIGAFIPIQRYFADAFEIKYADELFSKELIDLEHKTGDEFGKQRSGEDLSKTHQAGRKYFKGEDAWGNKFKDHQK